VFEELARKTQSEVARTYATFELWMTCAFIYLIMTITFSRLLSILEKKLKAVDFSTLKQKMFFLNSRF